LKTRTATSGFPVVIATFLLAAVLCASTAAAATFVVDTTADATDVSPGDGLCATASVTCSLRAAVQESGALAGADTIEMPAGIYVLTIAGRNDDAALSGDLDLEGDVTLTGAGVDETIIDAGALDRVVDIVRDGVSTTVRMERMTLRNGFLDGISPMGQGAGMRVHGAVRVDLVDVDIRDNVMAGIGGGAGIDNTSGCIHGLRVRVIGNRDPRPTGNRFAIGGGIMHRNLKGGTGACLVLDDSELSDNDGDTGGAVFADFDAPITIRRSLISGNSARFAGGLYLKRGNITLLENVTISGNFGSSGAVFNDGGSSVTLRHCTVTGNRQAPNSPGGSLAVVGGLGDVHGTSRTFLSNTIVAGNGPAMVWTDCQRAISIEGGGNIIGNTQNCILASLPTDQLNVDPQLGALADHDGRSRTHTPGAPAIDHALATSCLLTDQRGAPRPQDGDGDGDAACDIGAMEVGELTAAALFSDGFE
jgi:CSLREA domain-containing protein